MWCSGRVLCLQGSASLLVHPEGLPFCDEHLGPHCHLPAARFPVCRPPAALRALSCKPTVSAAPPAAAHAVQEADDIFGNVDDLLAMYEERRVARGGPEEELEEEEEYGEEDELDDEAAEARRLARVRPPGIPNLCVCVCGCACALVVVVGWWGGGGGVGG